jgi:hypothetical protein
MTFIKKSVLDPLDETKEYVCLETGEVISELEFMEWKFSMLLEDNSEKRDTPVPCLLDGFLQAEQKLNSLAAALDSDILVLPDINPDLEVGETGTTPLTFGGVDSIIHPIFSEVQRWSADKNLSFLVMQLSWLITEIKARIIRGDKVSEAKIEKISSYLDFGVKEITPLRDPPIMNPSFSKMKQNRARSKSALDEISKRRQDLSRRLGPEKAFEPKRGQLRKPRRASWSFGLEDVRG